jgi:dTDP-glucose 4,6-dehydratase
LDAIPAELKGGLEIVAGDLRDSAAVRQACAGCEVVFHLGALVGIPYSYLHPLEVVETNTLGTLHLLLAARDNQVERMIHTSTSEVYGTAERVPISEDHPLRGQSPYSASKIGAEKLAESFHAAYGLPVVILRPFNVYGPRQSARAVIPTIVSQALAKSAVRLGNLDATRDFTFVEDTVSAFVRAAEADEAVGRTINVGSEFEISIRDLANKILSLAGRAAVLEVEHARERPTKSEVRRLLSDSSLAHSLLGWRPQWTLDTGLQATIEWTGSHPEAYDAGRYEI